MWKILIRIGFILASLLTAGWVIAAWLYPVSTDFYNPHQAYNSQETSDEAFLPPPNIDPKYKTKKEQTNKEIEQWRADRSALAAQWHASETSQLTFRIGVLGVILLAWTIYQTLSAGNELRTQNKIAHNSSKPFLDIVEARVRQSRHNIAIPVSLHI